MPAARGVSPASLAILLLAVSCASYPERTADALDAFRHGDFEAAVRWQTKALDLAHPARKAELRTDLERYRSGRPYSARAQND